MDESIDDTPVTLRLLERIAAGEAAAFADLCDHHRDDLTAFVAARFDPRLRARADPSDVVQEAQLEAYRRLDDFLGRRPMAFHVWLRKTAYERLLMLRRRHLGAGRRAVGREEALPEASSMGLAQRLAGRGSAPDAPLVRAERVEQVRRALAGLSEDDREILLMRTYENRPYAEIAALLDLTPATARQRHGRALLRLTRLLSDEGFEGSADG
jgi:RNA polymerase sigma-70 factor (ECF subfamily)